MLDSIVIGGGSAGLSAALVLGRARRSVLVLDSGQPRNAPASAAHGVFTRDGTPPLDLLRIGREQLQPYSGVQLQGTAATEVRRHSAGFEVVTAESCVHAKTVLLAYGVKDDLPPIAGLESFWGSSVLHCPYCHGWEVRDEPLAYVASGDAAIEFGKLLLGWSRDLVLCTNGGEELSAGQREALTRNGIEVREQTISRLRGRDGMLTEIVFADGSVLSRRALFVRPAQHPGSGLDVQLGCARTEAGFLQVDEFGRTSVPGVYAAGDLITRFQQVIRAAASGAVAAASINMDLLSAEFDRVAMA